MPNVADAYGTNALTNAAESGNNTETVVATLTGVTPRFPGLTVKLRGWLNVLTGTGTTAGTVRLRKNSLVGAVVGPAFADNQGVAASKTCELAVEGSEAPGEGTFTYVLTYQGTGDTGVATFQACSLTALVN